jgi:hypothetical protein
MRLKMWRQVTKLNENHMLFAWISLVFVMVTEVYVRMCAMGVISDVRFF